MYYFTSHIGFVLVDIRKTPPVQLALGQDQALHSDDTQAAESLHLLEYICTVDDLLHSSFFVIRVLYGTMHRKHDGNSVCRLALFIVIAPLTVNIFDYLLAFNR